MTSIIAKRRGIQTMRMFPASEEKNTAYISFVDRFERGSIQDLEANEARGLIEGEIRKSFAYDLAEIASNLVIGNNLDSHVMFSRKLDELMLVRLPKSIPKSSLKAHVGSAFEATLPIVKKHPSRNLG